MMKFDTNKQNIFFLADTHFHHKNICSATSVWEDENSTRKFGSLEAMNTTLLQNINFCVGENDILFHLGDFSFQGVDNIKYFRDLINCKNIHLILGNHDQNIANNRETTCGIPTQTLFTSVQTYLEIEINKIPVVLSHYPLLTWRDKYKGSVQLFGHSHGQINDKIESNQFDVGVDNVFKKWGHYGALSWQQILMEL